MSPETLAFDHSALLRLLEKNLDGLIQRRTRCFKQILLARFAYGFASPRADDIRSGCNRWNGERRLDSEFDDTGLLEDSVRDHCLATDRVGNQNGISIPMAFGQAATSSGNGAGCSAGTGVYASRVKLIDRTVREPGFVSICFDGVDERFVL